MAKRKSKKKSFWSPPAVVGRVVWGRGGFSGAVRKVQREWIGPREVARVRIDLDGGKAKTSGALRQRRDGTFEYRPPKPKKKVTAKKRVADMQQRVATESDRHAKHQAAQKKPMAERVKRKADGTWNGSAKAAPGRTAAAQADAAYLKAVRAADRAERHANKLLRGQ